MNMLRNLKIFSRFISVYWGYHRQGSCQAGLSAAVNKVRSLISLSLYMTNEEAGKRKTIPIKNNIKMHLTVYCENISRDMPHIAWVH